MLSALFTFQMGIHDVVVDNRTVSLQTVHKIVEHKP